MPYATILDVMLILTRGDHVLLAQRQSTGYADGQWNLPSGAVGTADVERIQRTNTALYGADAAVSSPIGRLRAAAARQQPPSGGPPTP